MSSRRTGTDAYEPFRTELGLPGSNVSLRWLRETFDVANGPRVDLDALHREAQVSALTSMVDGGDPFELLAEVERFHVPGRCTPDVAILQLAVTALDLACQGGSEPLAYEGLRERYLPEVRFRGRVEHRNSQYALYAAACMRGGMQPDLLDDAGSWQTPLWIYAVYALVIYARAAAERVDVPLAEVARRIAAHHGLPGAEAPALGRE